jgi:hypothetical protein
LLLSNFLSGVASDVTLATPAGVLEEVHWPGLSNAEALIQYSNLVIPFDMHWNNMGDYKYQQICGSTQNGLGLELTLMPQNPFSVPLHIESGRVAVDLMDAPQVEDSGDFINFNPPYNSEIRLGYVDIPDEHITLPANIENAEVTAYTNGVTPINQIMCLDGIMDCGCDFSSVFFGPAGCPSTQLIRYMEESLGSGAIVLPPPDGQLPKAGTPGNGVLRMEGGVVVSVGHCVYVDGQPQDEDAENGLVCYKQLDVM